MLFRWAFINHYFIRSEIASREQFILRLNAKVRYKCDEIVALLSFDSIFFNSILLQRVYFARLRWVGASIINPRHLTLYFPSVDPLSRLIVQLKVIKYRGKNKYVKIRATEFASKEEEVTWLSFFNRSWRMQRFTIILSNQCRLREHHGLLSLFLQTWISWQCNNLLP